MDQMIHCLNNPSLMAEVHQFCIMAQELERLKEVVFKSPVT